MTSEKSKAGDKPKPSDKTAVEYSRDDQVQIKPYKGRRKLEMYLHNKELRQLLEATPLSLPAEGLLEARSLAKTVIFKDPAYGEMLQAMVAFVARGLRAKKPQADLQESLNSVVATVIEEFNLNTPKMGDDDGERLKGAYAQVASLLSGLGAYSR